MIENTSDRDPILHMLGVLADGQSGYITDMESAGQRQMVNSTKIPTSVNRGDDSELETLGFTLSPPDPADPLFRDATLPAGWTKEGSDHAMWSYIKDSLGRTRISIFYKAAFYDRRAFLSIQSVSSHVARVLAGDEKLALDGWATRDAVTEAVGMVRRHAAESLPYQGEDTYYTDEIVRCDKLIAQLESESDRAEIALETTEDRTRDAGGLE